MREANDVRIRATQRDHSGKRHDATGQADDVGRERSHERDDDHQAHTGTRPRPYATNAEHPKHSTNRRDDQSDRGGSIRTDQLIITDTRRAQHGLRRTRRTRRNGETRDTQAEDDVPGARALLFETR